MSDLKVRGSLENFKDLIRIYDINEDDIDESDGGIDVSEVVTVESLSDDLFRSTVDEQIKTLNFSSYQPNNLVDMYESRWTYFSSLYQDEPELFAQGRDARREFYLNLLNKIELRFNIKFTYEEQSLIRLATDLYNIFVLNYKSNLRNFIISYILKFKNEFVKRYNNVGRIISFSKKFEKRNDAVIIANLGDIIKDITENDDVKEINFNTILERLYKYDEDEFYINDIYDIFNSDRLENIVTYENMDEENPFTNAYFEILRKQLPGYTEIIMEVQIKLYNYFPTKKELVASAVVSKGETPSEEE